MNYFLNYFCILSGSAACQGDSGGPLAQSLNGKMFLLGIVSYGPKDCRNNLARRPDIFTDIRSFARWIRSETGYYDKLRWTENGNIDVDPTPTNDTLSDSQSLVPNCGENFCFYVQGGECSFTRSIYTKCSDKVTCQKELIPSSDPFISGGEKTLKASSVGAISHIGRPSRRKRHCTKWKYNSAIKDWRCLRFKKIRRKRRQLPNLDYNGLICPIMSCIDRHVLMNEWSTPQQAKECVHLNSITSPSLPSGKHSFAC